MYILINYQYLTKFLFGKKKGFKYSVGYSDIKNVRPSRIMLPKISANGKDFDETKYMFFL